MRVRIRLASSVAVASAILVVLSGCASHADPAHGRRASHATDTAPNAVSGLRRTADRPAWTRSFEYDPNDYKSVAVLVVGNYQEQVVGEQFIDLSNNMVVARVTDQLNAKGYSLVTRSSDELGTLYDEIGFQSKQTGNHMVAEQMAARFGQILKVSAVFMIDVRVAIDQSNFNHPGSYSVSVKELRVPDGAILGSGTRLVTAEKHADPIMLDILSRMAEEIASGIPAVGNARR